jgi:Cu/Ag efflux pump CusA
VGAVFVPTLFLSAEPGAFLPSIAFSYLLAVGASMVVALTVTPALGMLLLGRGPTSLDGSPIVRWVQRQTSRILARPSSRSGPVVALFAALVMVTLVAAPFVHTSWRPALKERDVLVHLAADPGTSLPRMTELTTQAVDDLRSVPGVTNAGAHIGRAVTSDEVVNVDSGEIWVSVDPSADYGSTIEEIDAVMAAHPDLESEVLTYSNERVTEVLQEADDDIVVRFYGEDPDVLSGKAEELRRAVAGLEGIRRANVELPRQEPTLEIEVDLARAQDFGVKPGDARRAAAILLSGLRVGNLFEEQKVFDVVVWGAPGIRENEADVLNLLIETPNGRHVRLDDIADVRIADNPSVIRHESVSRYVDVTADVRGRDVGDVAADVDAAITRLEFPLEHHAELLGGFSDREAARARAIAVSVAAAIAVFLLLQAAFASWRSAALVFLTLPAALAGGVVAIALTDGVLSLGSAAGLAGVLGLATRHAVVSVRQYRRLQQGHPAASVPELVQQATVGRVGAVLAATLVTAAVTIPFLFGADAPGSEILRPIAITLVGGLVTSAAYNLVILPAAYLRFAPVVAVDTDAEDVIVDVSDIDAVERV